MKKIILVISFMLVFVMAALGVSYKYWPGKKEIGTFFNIVNTNKVEFLFDFQVSKFLKDSLFMDIIKDNKKLENLLNEKNDWNIDIKNHLKNLSFFSSDFQVFEVMRKAFLNEPLSDSDQKLIKENLFSAWIEFQGYDKNELQEKLLSRFPFFKKEEFEIDKKKYFGLSLKDKNAKAFYPVDAAILFPEGLLLFSESKKDSLFKKDNEHYKTSFLEESLYEYKKKEHLFFLLLNDTSNNFLEALLDGFKNQYGIDLKSMPLSLDLIKSYQFILKSKKMKPSNMEGKEEGQAEEWLELQMLMEADLNSQKSKDPLGQIYMTLELFKVFIEMKFKELGLESIQDYRFYLSKKENKNLGSMNIAIKKSKLKKLIKELFFSSPEKVN